MPENRMTMTLANPQPAARFAGLLYLAIILAGVWSEGIVRASLIVQDDAAATAAKVLANENLFLLSFGADAAMALCDVALAVLLFLLLRPAGPGLALAAMVFRLVQAAILGMNLLGQYAALLVLRGAGDADLALLFLQLQSHGYDLGLLFFGVNSLLTGILLVRAAWFPSILGWLVAAAGLVYLAGSATRFLAPELNALIQPAYAIPLLAESAFCLWLLIRGIRVDAWRA